MIEFQSHAGSIEACDAYLAEWEGGWRFNPTLVRLRRSIRLGEQMKIPLFQSHAGSIEAPTREAIREADHLGFQSHAGSIEAVKGSTDLPALIHVSIPRWFD